ncbi:MAG: phage tail protein [Deltaproteobacteria bacterium]|nr:phage tail protein [Deltaproteobacteria bacterium]
MTSAKHAKNVSTAGHFELTIDGHKTTAFLKSVDGGQVKTSIIDEPIGHGNQRIKHTSVAEIEPITIDFGFAGAADLLKWIQDSWRREFGRRSGEIIHANFDMQPTYQYQFYDALLLETVFPALDGNSKDAGYVKIKVQPERMVEERKSGGPQISGKMGSKQKLWSLSSFRFELDGIPEMKFVNHIDSFTVKQGVKKMYTGIDRFPQIEPTKLEFPNISGTLAAGYCDALLKWHGETNHRGATDPKVQKHGAIEFLGPDKSTVLYRIELYEVGLYALSMPASTANAEQIKRIKFELYVGRMDIDGKGSLGLE